MVARLFFLNVAFLLVASGLGQNIPAPPRLDDLIGRASEFRRLLAAGDRVKASQLVVESKRKEFLNKSAIPLENVRLVGMDFVDKDHVSIRVAGEALVSGGAGAQLTEPQVVDLWVRERGVWYFQPDTSEIPFSGMFKKDVAADAMALAEIKSNFKLVTQTIDIGELWQGDHKEVPIQFRYSGDAPIRIVSKVDSPVTMLDISSTQSLTKVSNQFEITAGSDDFDGPFDIPVTFTIYYKTVALDQSVRFRGNIRPMFKYRQAPQEVPPNSKEEFSIFLTNNTDETAEFGGLGTDGKFYVNQYPHRLAAGEEAVITLQRNLDAGGTPGTKVSIALTNHLKGRGFCEIRIH